MKTGSELKSCLYSMTKAKNNQETSNKEISFLSCYIYTSPPWYNAYSVNNIKNAFSKPPIISNHPGSLSAGVHHITTSNVACNHHIIDLLEF